MENLAAGIYTVYKLNGLEIMLISLWHVTNLYKTCHHLAGRLAIK